MFLAFFLPQPVVPLCGTLMSTCVPSNRVISVWLASLHMSKINQLQNSWSPFWKGQTLPMKDIAYGRYCMIGRWGCSKILGGFPLVSGKLQIQVGKPVTVPGSPAASINVGHAQGISALQARATIYPSHVPLCPASL